jgi:manganese oxidase
MGGIMTTIEYAEVNAKSHSFYRWKNKVFVPDFYYEESIKKPLGFYDNPAFKGKPAP